ncbi:Pseudouridine synthase RluB [Helicobacter trogontum]|uniref:Pseudouridine synthase n=1 Tax=Helicobacter trogontum TaxID=50960 RepID=A0ABQ0D1U7_9HELI
MRLNHFIALHSKYSRREADRLIMQGAVKINHTIATQHSLVPSIALQTPYVAVKEFKVFIHGKMLHYARKPSYTAIIYHKPKGELVSKKDAYGRRLIYDGLNARYAHFMPVGRLDFASEGLLILSDNKEVVSKLMHSNLARTYILKIDSRITKPMIKAMEEGLILHNAKAGGHRLSKINAMQFMPMEYDILKSASISKLKVRITEGKNREVRRFFAHFHANVLDLRRVSYGFVNLNALPVGKTRFFTKQEYDDLHKFMNEKDFDK